MAKSIGTLLVEIGADVSGLELGGRNATKTLNDIGDRSRAVGAQLAKLGAAAAAAGAAMAAAFVKSGLDAIDTQAKLARSLGASIDGLRGLQLAANGAGVSSETLKSALQQFNQKLGEVQRGTGDARKVIAMLGLDAEKLAAMDLDERMATVADRIRELGLSTSQAADVLNKFGITSLEMVDLIRQGGDVIRAARADVDAFGLSLSAVDAAKVEQANDAMGRISLTFEAIRNRITVAVAPILKALADKFNEIAVATRGFGDQVAGALHIVHVAFKGLQLAAATVGEIFWQVARTIGEIFTGLVDVINAPINAAIRGLNRLGANIAELPSANEMPFMDGLRSIAATATEITAKVREEFLDLATAEWPTAGLEKFLNDVREKAQEAGAIGSGTFESPNEQEEQEREKLAKELERQREALQAKLDQVVEFSLAEDEMENARHKERLQTIRDALDAELMTEEEYNILKQRLEEDHMARLAEIRKKGMSELEKFTSMSFRDQVKTVTGALADMTAGLSQHSKTMFELNKIAGIANAIISTHQGMAKALELGWPMGPIAAAAIGVQGFAQVAAIRAQQFGGGGNAAPSLAGGTPATPVTPVTSGTPQQQSGGGQVIVLEGLSPDSLFTGRTVRELAERLQEHIADGGVVRFA